MVMVMLLVLYTGPKWWDLSKVFGFLLWSSGVVGFREMETATALLLLFLCIFSSHGFNRAGKVLRLLLAFFGFLFMLSGPLFVWSGVEKVSGCVFFWRHRLSKCLLSVFGVTESGAEISRLHYFFQSSGYHMCKRSLGSSLGYHRHHSFELFSCAWRIYVRNPKVLGLGFGERVGIWSGKRNFVWWLFAGSRVQAVAAEELQTKPLEEDNETHEQTWSGTLSISSTTEINQTKYPFLWCTGLVYKFLIKSNVALQDGFTTLCNIGNLVIRVEDFEFSIFSVVWLWVFMQCVMLTDC